MYFVVIRSYMHLILLSCLLFVYVLWLSDFFVKFAALSHIFIWNVILVWNSTPFQMIFTSFFYSVIKGVDWGKQGSRLPVYIFNSDI